MSVKARNIVEDALKLNQALGVGQRLDSDEANDVLTFLNSMLGSFSAEGGMVYTTDNETFNLTGAQLYTIGTGGDFNTERPVEIMAAYVSDGEVDYPLRVRDAKYYSNEGYKDLVSVPDYIYYDNNFPLARIYFQPIPDSSYTFTMLSRKQLTQFDTLDTVYNMPNEYRRMLTTNLAVEIAPLYEKEPTPTVLRNARQSKKTVMVANNRHVQNLMENALTASGRPFNIYTGGYE